MLITEAEAKAGAAEVTVPVLLVVAIAVVTAVAENTKTEVKTARSKICRDCSRMGHFGAVCRSKNKIKVVEATVYAHNEADSRP